MKLEIGYNYSKVMIEETDPAGLASSIKSLYAYNQNHYDTAKALGLDVKNFNLSDPKIVKQALPHTRKRGMVWEQYRNWMIKRYNQLMGKPLYMDTTRRTPIPFTERQCSEGTKYAGVRDYSESKGYLRVFTGSLYRIIKLVKQQFPQLIGNIEFEDLRDRSLIPTEETNYTVGPLTAFDYQKRDIDKIKELVGRERFFLKNSLLLNLAVDYGKTFTASCLSLGNFKVNDKGIIRNPNSLFAFNRKDLFIQAALDYLKAGIEVSLICTKHGNTRRTIDRYLEHNNIETRPKYDSFGEYCLVMIPTFMSGLKVKRYKKSSLYKYDIGFFDETQLLLTPTGIKFIDLTKLACKIGYSGTPFKNESQQKNMLTYAMFGGAVVKVTVADNINAGKSSPTILESINYPHTQDEHLRMIGLDYKGRPKEVSKEYLILKGEGKLNALRYQLNKYKTRQTVLFTGNLELKYQPYLKRKLESWGFDSVEITNGEDKDTFDKMERFRKGEIQIIIVNSIFSTGINLKNLSHFINFDPTSNVVLTIQALIGRTVRKGQSEDFAVITDFFETEGVYKVNSINRYRELTNPENGLIVRDIILEYHPINRKLYEKQSTSRSH